MKKVILSIILSITLLFSVVAIPSLETAATHNLPTSYSSSEVVSKQTDELTNIGNIFKYVDKQAFLANGFVKRIEEDEGLNSYIYEREDGTRSLFFFGEDVKFINGDKKVVEKDISLCQTDDGFITKQNNVGLILGRDFSRGVTVSFEDYKLSLLPASKDEFKCGIQMDNSLIYPEIYGRNTELIFTPILTGVKQDIVLKQYEGINSFDFIVTSDVLSPYFDNGALFFAETKDAKIRFTVGEVYVFDASGRFVLGDIELKSAGENKWIITLNVSNDFLTSDNTTYPVVIDPSFKVEASDSSSYIADTTVYSGKPNLATGTWQYNHAGFVSNGYDVGRMLVSIQGLTTNTVYNKLLYTQISSAKFCVRDSSGTAAQQVDLYKYTGTAWSESTATWNNTNPNGNYVLIDSQNPSASTFAEYDITSLVWDWKQNLSDISLGFMLKSLNETDEAKNKAFDSSESITDTRRPYIQIDYIPQIFLEQSISINEGESYALNAVLLPPGATIIWESNNPAVATVNNNGVVMAIKANAYPATVAAKVYIEGVEYSATCSVYVKIPNDTYYLKSKSFDQYVETTGFSTGNEVIRNSFIGDNSQRWDIEYLRNGLYSIKNKFSNKYLGVEILNSTTAITRQYSTLNDASKWYISKTPSGAYRLYAKGNLSYGYVIGANSSNDNAIVNMPYVNNNEYKDEWLFVDATTIYGSKVHRVLTDGERSVINCQGYAMMRNDKPWHVDYNCDGVEDDINNDGILDELDSWNHRTYSYIKTISSIDSNVKNAVSLYTKADFEEWLTNMGYNWVYEEDFSGNGENNPLLENQYRVVLRTGIRYLLGYGIFYDYHFWYQTFSGAWSNKHGLTEEDPLDEGITPFSPNTTGWDCGDITNHYDGLIYSYIITE